RVVEDAEIEVEPGGVVALGDQHVPQGERVLAPRDGHEHALVPFQHAVLADRLPHLVAEELQEVGRAEGGVVPSQLQHGGAPALATRHPRPPPPALPGPLSIVSPSLTTWSAVTSSSPRITSTVSGRISSSRSTSFTRRLP